MSTIGGLITAAAQRQQGKAQQAIYEHNARVTEDEAAAELEAGRASSTAYRREAESLAAGQRAAFGKSGVMLTGTPFKVLAKTAAREEANARTIMYNSQVRSTRLKNQAHVLRFQGSQARRIGKMRSMATLFDTAGKAAYGAGIGAKT
jgi:hypothetical protein